MPPTISETRRPGEEASASSLGRRALGLIRSTTGLTSSGVTLLAVSVVAWILGRVVAGRPMYLLPTAA